VRGLGFSRVGSIAWLRPPRSRRSRSDEELSAKVRASLGWLYVAAVIDLFSRRVVGWSMSAAMTAQLVTVALVMAIWRRSKPDGLLNYSDRGSQCTSESPMEFETQAGLAKQNATVMLGGCQRNRVRPDCGSFRRPRRWRERP
jgi:transposase InsO family protein